MNQLEACEASGLPWLLPYWCATGLLRAAEAYSKVGTRDTPMLCPTGCPCDFYTVCPCQQRLS